MPHHTEFLVSAIVSTYRSSRFIRGCLEDLITQTLYKEGNLEIVVVDSASDENEADIVKEFQERYPHIKYIRTEQRQTVYGAWNTGIQACGGKYITNANTDDRHHPQALKKMASILESSPHIALVYADVYVTNTPNETFESSAKKDRYTWFDWDRDKLLYHGCFIGPQPMWRRSLHEKWGYFDESLVVSGDAEFWLRISQEETFYHINEPLGLYLKHDESIEHSNKNRRDFENLRIITLYREASHRGKIIRKHSFQPIMEFDKDILSIIAILKDPQNKEPLIDLITSFTEGNFEVIPIDMNHKEGLGFMLNNSIARIKGQNVAIITDNILFADKTLNHLVTHLRDDIMLTSPVTNVLLKLMPLPYKDFQGLRGFANDYRQSNLYRSIRTQNVCFDCLTLKIDIFSSIGIFDERFRNLKDCLNDICIRTALSGFKIEIAGDVYVHIADTTLRYKSDKKVFESKWGGIDANSELGSRLLILKIINDAYKLQLMSDLDNAVKTILQGIKMFPENHCLQSALLRILYLSSMYDDVIKIANSLKYKDEEDDFYLILSLIHSSRLQEAETLFQLAKLKDYKLEYVLACLNFKKGNLTIATDLLKSVIKKMPSWGEPYRDLGLIQYSEDNREQGLLNIERAFILNPCISRIADLYHMFVSTYKLYDRSEPLFRDALRLNNHCRKIANFLIDVLVKQGNYKDALLEICRYLVNFGFDDSYISNALLIRDKVGFLDNTGQEDSISVCMIVKDEETNICSCLLSVLPIADEIIVVDTGSSDRTIDLAKIFGAKIFHHKWDEDFSKARNISVEHANGKWILIIDADEVISSQDYDIIRELVKERHVAYQIVTRNYNNQDTLLGFIENDDSYPEERGLGWIPTMKVRLFPNDRRIRFKGRVHEMVDDCIKALGMEIKTAPFFIHHYGKLDVYKDRQKGEKYYELGKEKLNQDPNDKKSIKELAIVSGALGKIDEAIQLWQRFIELGFTDDIDCYLNLANLKMIKGQYEDALSFVDKALKIDDGNITAKRTLDILKRLIYESERDNKTP
ncbi:MAG: glycosyltransferase [Thermodesulfovibrionales bacterium]|nr:glycosyltransferase [Thermodesulfovibrionales bacterium]